jgi:hypothetical protein
MEDLQPAVAKELSGRHAGILRETGVDEGVGAHDIRHENEARSGLDKSLPDGLSRKGCVRRTFHRHLRCPAIGG